MNVLELCLSTGVGGLEHYAIRTAKQLTTHGISCVAVVANNTMTARAMSEAGITTISLHRLSKIFPIFAAKQLAQIIDKHAIDVMHLHWSNDFNLAVLAKRFATRPVKLVYTRQMMITRHKHDIYHRFLYRHVDLLLTITEELRQLALRYLPMPANRVQTLYYGVEEPPQLNAAQRTALRESLGIPQNSFAIGMVGRIEPGKGQYLLIEAVQALLKANYLVHTTLIGPAMNDAYLQSLKKTVEDIGLQQEINFYGSHKNPVEIMSAFDVVVLATKQETFGLVLIEAMRNGVAVIGTNAGGVPEIIDDGKTGLLFEPEDAEGLERCLIRLMQDVQLCESLARAGKQKADVQFSQELHYDRLVKLVQGLVENAGKK